MSANLYLRRLLIGLALTGALALGSPLAVFGGAYLMCGGQLGGGCGDLGLLIIFMGVMPALVGILGFIAWTVFRRLRTLELSAGYILLALFLLMGCFQSFFAAVPAAQAGFLGWELIAPPLLATTVLIVLYWVPEVSERGVISPLVRIVLIVTSILLLLRLATAILYPLWLVPSGLEMSFAVRRLAYLGPLKRIPDPVIILTFVALLLVTLKQWRSPDGREPVS